MTPPALPEIHRPTEPPARRCLRQRPDGVRTAIAGALLALATTGSLAQPAPDPKPADSTSTGSVHTDERSAGGGPAADPAYREALDDLEARRYRRAIDRLNAVATRDPANRGALLDLAMAYCLAGEPDAAARLFLGLEAQPDLPPAIAEIIAYYRAGGCRPRPLGLQGFVSAGGGYARNLNLAPLSGLIWLPGLGIDLPLGEGSRPRHSVLSQLEAGAVYALSGDEAWTLGGFAQGTRYRDATDYSLDSLQASLNFRRAGPTLRTEAQLAHARLWLGGRAHLGATVAGGTVLAGLGDGWAAGPSLALTQLAYSELSAFDARQVELRGRLQWQGAALRISLDAGWQHDAPQNARPGGDRRGPVMQVRASWLAGAADSVDLVLRQTWLNDREPYNEALFGDLRRASRSTTVQAAWRHALAPRLNARLDYRYQVNRDPVGLFAYDAQSAVVSLEWSFAR